MQNNDPMSAQRLLIVGKLSKSDHELTGQRPVNVISDSRSPTSRSIALSGTRQTIHGSDLTVHSDMSVEDEEISLPTDGGPHYARYT